MKNILYITANSKPEILSASKSVSRAIIDRLKAHYPDCTVEELDLYEENIPRPKYNYFSSRSCSASGPALQRLTAEEQEDVKKMNKLCDQFVSATVYVLAAPMWSLSFPGILKDYIDSIVLKDKTITFDDQKPKGLLDDKERSFLYVQSSGGNIPWLARPVLNKGLNYVEELMKLLGIKHVETLLVDDTGTTEEEGRHAIDKATEKIDSVLERLELRPKAAIAKAGFFQEIAHLGPEQDKY